MKLKLLFSILTIITCMLNAQVPNYVPTNGLVGWWPFNGNANDQSGSSNNGTVNGATITNDRFGNSNNAYSLTPNNGDFIEISNAVNLNPTTEISISAWTYLNQYNNNQNFASKSYTNQTLPYVSYSLKMGDAGVNDKAQLHLSIKGTRVVLQTVNSIPTMQWNLITGTYNGQIMKIYVNGVLENSALINGNITSYLTNLNFGRWSAGSTSNPQYLNGLLDDIGIWNRALSACEITQLYNAGLNTLAITSQPLTQTITANSNAVFTTEITSSNTYTLQWQQDNGTGFVNLSNAGLYSGVNTKTLTITNVPLSINNNIYRCAITTTNSCSSNTTTAAANLFVTTITGINTVYLNANSVYSNNKIIYINSTNITDCILSIYDLTGKEVYMDIAKEQNTTTINTGIYFAKITDKNKNILLTKKIVIE